MSGKLYGTAASYVTMEKGLFRDFFLESRFQNHPNIVILQKYQSLPNSAHVPSLNLKTLGFLLNLDFVCSSLTATTEKANACRLWTSCYC